MLLQDLVFGSAASAADKTALIESGERVPYAALAERIRTFAGFLSQYGLRHGDRVGVYLNKQLRGVEAYFGTACAGGVFVPINPRLKPEQVAHILNDCGVRLLVTNEALSKSLGDTLSKCLTLEAVLSIDGVPESPVPGIALFDWHEVSCASYQRKSTHIVDTDIAAIFYTSGSTGMPKGVVLSHRNVVASALSVATYLENNSDDVVLAVLPLSFDAGFSQLTTMFSVTGTVVLMNYLLPQDVIRALASCQVTGLAGVPTLWNRLAPLEWTAEARQSLRFITNTGGAMPQATLAILRKKLPGVRPYLMYGLTEAFRSTYLPPQELDKRPTSIGKPIPNVDIRVVKDDGSECAAHEYGQLVHRGPLVAQGYWNNAEATARRFKPWPFSLPERKVPEMAVWSGDTVYRDEEGYLYFVGRNDAMVKSSGYRISPFEVEACVHRSCHVLQCAAFGVAHADLGQAVIVACSSGSSESICIEDVLSMCRRELPAFMVPRKVVVMAELPTTATGKIDRGALAKRYADAFGTGA